MEFHTANSASKFVGDRDYGRDILVLKRLTSLYFPTRGYVLHTPKDVEIHDFIDTELSHPRFRSTVTSGDRQKRHEDDNVISLQTSHSNMRQQPFALTRSALSPKSLSCSWRVSGGLQ